MSNHGKGRPWTPGYALPRGPVRGLRRAYTDDERREIARAIVAHLRLCGWNFSLPEPAIGHGMGGAASRMREPMIAIDRRGSCRLAICVGRRATRPPLAPRQMWLAGNGPAADFPLCGVFTFDQRNKLAGEKIYLIGQLCLSSWRISQPGKL